MCKVFRLLKNKRILITGANGFMGRHLIKALSVHEAEINVIIRKPIKLSFVSNLYIGDLKDSIFIKGTS